MMDKSEVRAVLRESLRPMRAALSLNEWHVDFRLKPLEKACAECLADPDYSRAILTFDPEDFKDGGQLLTSLLHEMIHMILAKWELYRKAVRPFVDDEKAWVSLDEIHTHCSEDTVRRIEDLLTHGVGTTPRRLITRGRRLLDLEE